MRNLILLVCYCSQWFKDTIWKQITTQWKESPAMVDCSQWFKDTNLKANHNWWGILYYWFAIVPNGSKILFESKSQRNEKKAQQWSIVPNGSKILIWKQITTACEFITTLEYCSQWFKDTNLKANHNALPPRT